VWHRNDCHPLLDLFFRLRLHLPYGHDERGTDQADRKLMISRSDAACDLHVEKAVGQMIAPHDLPADHLQHWARFREGDPQLAEGTLEPIKMQLLVDQP